jgi:micrococcal nuclease
MGCGFSSPSDQVLVEPPSPPSKQPIKATVHGRQSESPVYTSLPKGTQKFPVRNVYDGDTLTLVDERRVRFLGIDTPELKEKQAFAQEAKDYAKQYCHKKDIYLLIDGTDHYGRLLAHIFVPYGGAYLCVNEGLVQEGLAYAYIPNKDEKKFNWTKILALQTEARTLKKGVWSKFKDSKVFVTPNGSAYHQRSCTHLSRSKNLDEIKVSQAADKGLHPCRTCMADA